MSYYSRRILPKLIEKSCAVGPVMKQRAKVVPLAKGRVLEVGAGGGLNLEFYDPTLVSNVVGIDPSKELLGSAEEKAAGAGLPFEPVSGDAGAMAFDDDSFDTVLVTYTLCSVPDMGRAISEMRRVLAPGGKLIFCEHGLAPDKGVALAQNLITPLWRQFAGGCNLNRDIPAAIATAGFAFDWREKMYLPKTWRFAGFNNWGVAHKI